MGFGAIALLVVTIISALTWLSSLTSPTSAGSASVAGLGTLLLAGLTAWLIVRRQHKKNPVNLAPGNYALLSIGIGVAALGLGIWACAASLSVQAAIAGSVTVPISGPLAGTDAYDQTWGLQPDATVATAEDGFTSVTLNSTPGSDLTTWSIGLTLADGSSVDCSVDRLRNWDHLADGGRVVVGYCSETVMNEALKSLVTVSVSVR